MRRAALLVAILVGLSGASSADAATSTLSNTPPATLTGPPAAHSSPRHHRRHQASPAPAPVPTPAPKPARGSLPMTGADLTLELTLAAALVGGGVLARFAGRARRG